MTLTLNDSHHHELDSSDGRLGRQVREIMTPGIVTIAEDASLEQVYRAMAAHRVHAIVVVGAREGNPLGWVTARGLLAWAEHDPAFTAARDAISEQPTSISPSASAHEALVSMSQPGVSHLLVARAPGFAPEGAVSELDLAVLLGG